MNHAADRTAARAGLGVLVVATAIVLALGVAAPGSAATRRDRDRDGLSDSAEARYKTNPRKADTDADGLKDGAEVNRYKTKPRRADTDGDALRDGAEVKRHRTNPRAANTDRDGLKDGVEVTRYRTDPRRADTDRDGLTDGAEVNRYGTKPRVADTDGDGFKDGVEVTWKTDPFTKQKPAGGPCYGPAAFDDGCGPVAGVGWAPLNPVAVRQQNGHVQYIECHSAFGEQAVRSCNLGDLAAPTRTIAVVGDSHALSWAPAVVEMGEARGWKVVVSTRSSCPFTDARRVLPNEPPERAAYCRDGNVEIEQRLIADASIDTVFVSALSSAYGWAQPPGGDLDDPAVDGFQELWTRLTNAGKQVVVLRDFPLVKNRESSPNCLLAQPGEPLACANTRANGLVPDAEADAVDGAPDGVRLIDLSSRFCDGSLCHAVVGGVIVYRDYGHLAKEYSRLLAPYVGGAFDAVDGHA